MVLQAEVDVKREDYREGMPVTAEGRKGIAVELEHCADDSYVVHIAFPGKEAQWRVPIDKVEAR